MIALKGKDRRHLRSIGHELRPAVMVGREGLTDAVLAAIDQAHNGSELIKLKILEPGEVDRKAFAAELDERSASQVVGMVGGVLLLFRRDEDSPKISLPSESSPKV